MANTYFAADHHFFHSKILTFTKHDGSKLRNFSSVDEMNYCIVDRHNSVVGPNDTVYFLGDVTLSQKEADLIPLSRMNGNKVLILGNHDIMPLEVYMRYFKKVKAIHALSDMVLTHIPIHPNSLSRWGNNVHGHLHSSSINDPRYVCVSMEQLDQYTPISLDKLRNSLGCKK